MFVSLDIRVRIICCRIAAGRLRAVAARAASSESLIAVQVCILEADRLMIRRWRKDKYSLVSHIKTYAGDSFRYGLHQKAFDDRCSFPHNSQFNGLNVHLPLSIFKISLHQLRQLPDCTAPHPRYVCVHRHLPANEPLLIPPKAICRVAEPIALSSCFPYSWVMVKDFHVGDRSSASFWAGICISSFALAEAVTGFAWGGVSDRIGRRPVLLIGYGNPHILAHRWLLNQLLGRSCW